MSVRIAPQVGGYIAGADLTCKKYFFVKLDTSNQDKVILAGAGEAAIGILNTEGEADCHVAVSETGHEFLELGGAVSIGDKIKSDANGNGVAAVATDNYYAVAIEAGVSGDQIEVKLEIGVA